MSAGSIAVDVARCAAFPSSCAGSPLGARSSAEIAMTAVAGRLDVLVCGWLVVCSPEEGAFCAIDQPGDEVFTIADCPEMPANDLDAGSSPADVSARREPRQH